MCRKRTADNLAMRVEFTKMQGAGNDFLVFDETAGLLGLTAAHYRWLADRHFGVGADQILSVRPAPLGAASGVDFAYVIHNADGQEVEHCGNGARCFVRFVRERGLTSQTTIKVQTQNRVLQLSLQGDDRVTVDMGEPDLSEASAGFDSTGLTPVLEKKGSKWPLVTESIGSLATDLIAYVSVLSMGNPHAVQRVDDVDTAPVALNGPLVESHWRFAQRVNAGFMQVVSRSQIRLRVYERGAGETLACGTGACAAVVAGIQLGWLDERVEVEARGGHLTVQWAGTPGAPVLLTGPATTVFSASIELPDNL